jgi:hypothetical protein
MLVGTCEGLSKAAIAGCNHHSNKSHKVPSSGVRVGAGAAFYGTLAGHKDSAYKTRRLYCVFAALCNEDRVKCSLGVPAPLQ